MMASKSFVFAFSGFEVRERELRLTHGGEPLPIEPKAFRVLVCLLRSPGQVVSKEELLRAVWGDIAVTDNSLTRAIALLRRVLDDEARNPRYIETVSTVGYRFVCNVDVYEDSSTNAGPNQRLNRSGGDLVEAASDRSIAVATTAPPEESDRFTSPEVPTRNQEKRRVRRWMWLPASGAVLFAAAGCWYLLRPLPPPRVTGYSQITWDGAPKLLIGTDGNRLFFENGASDSVAQVAVTGGAISAIPVPGPKFAFPEDVSPDGANFLIATREKGLVLDYQQWNVRVPGGPLRHLPNGANAAFSPDGNSVAWQTAQGEVWVARSDGSGAHKLASGRSFFSAAISPNGAERFFFGRVAWSPDGSLLRFGSGGRLWEISADGSNLHEVIPGWHLSSTQCCGSWTPDGKLFVFVDTPGGPIAQSEIWAVCGRCGVLPHAPGRPVQLTSGPIAWVQPITGRDGKTIFATGRTRRGELVRFDFKTRQFEPFLGGISAQFVSLSRDGQFVAYVRYPEFTLWTARSDGSNPVQLTEPPINALLPRWSPDGTQIVFWDAASTVSAYLVAARGGGIPQKLPGNPEPQSDPNWSADGKEILFSTTSPFHRSGNLRILDLATQKMTTVTGSDGLFSPRWSPDGRLIAAMPMDATGLKVFDFRTQKWSWLAQGGKFFFPSWSRDSQFLYFAHDTEGDVGIFRIRATGGHEERITGLNNIHLGGSWRWVGLDPTDAPLALRDVGSDDIYALTLERK